MLAAAALSPGTSRAANDGGDPCAPHRAGEQCGDGAGRQTAGGGEKVSHAGWPAITGILWKVTAASGGAHDKTGTEDNDELLGHHGSDHLIGGPGRDVLWGDWDPSGQPGSQQDVLRGNDGGDWLYSSHGHDVLDAGAGTDHVWAYYGSGTIDCGPGYDVARIRMDGAYTTKNCEVVGHFGPGS